MLVYDQYLFDEIPDLDEELNVFHSGFATTISNYSYGYDRRNYYLIHLVTKGKGVYEVNGKSFDLCEGDGFVIYPNETIVHTADKEFPWTLCWVAFWGTKADGILKEAGFDREHLIFHYDQDDFLEDCIRNIYNETRTNRNLLYIKSYLYRFLGKLLELHVSASRRSDLKIKRFNRFDDAMIYIRRNIHHPIQISELANYLRMDPSEVYRIFMNKLGKPPSTVIRQMRIEKACEYLRKTDLPIKDIADTMNYEYQSHFNKQFFSVMGMSPSSYRAVYSSTKL